MGMDGDRLLLYYDVSLASSCKMPFRLRISRTGDVGMNPRARVQVFHYRARGTPHHRARPTRPRPPPEQAEDAAAEITRLCRDPGPIPAATPSVPTERTAPP